MRGWGQLGAPRREGVGSVGDTGEAACGLGLGFRLSFFSGRCFHHKGVLGEARVSYPEAV